MFLGDCSLSDNVDHGTYIQLVYIIQVSPKYELDMTVCQP